jgi:hypothetical protein
MDRALWLRTKNVLFLAYFGAVVALQRDFSRLHVRVGDLPLFTGEVAIVFFCLVELVLFAKTRRPPFLMHIEDWMVAAYCAVGSVFAVQGLSNGFGLAAVRDFALVYYAAFFFLTRAFLARGGRVEHVAATLVAGAIIGSASTSLKFIIEPTLTWEHGAPPNAALVGWIGLVGIALLWGGTQHPVARMLFAASILPCSFAVYLSAYRTVGLVIAGSLGVLAVLASLRRRVVYRRALALALVWCLLFFTGLAAHLALMPAQSSQLPQDGPTTVREGAEVITLRWLGPIVRLAGPGTESSPTRSRGDFLLRLPALQTQRIGTLSSPQGSYGSSDFRVLAWRKAVARIRQAPMAGIGFGPPAALFPDHHCQLASSPLSNCGNAHNTYLTVAMRMGLPVLLLLLVLNGLIVVRATLTERQSQATLPDDCSGPFLLVTLAAFAGYATLSLFLESPYLSTPYWIALACLAHLAHIPTPARTAERSSAVGTR